MKPTTAVIFAAGTGTRMLPITAAVQKELLPVGTRPVIDYVVADLVAAGISRIIFVIRPGQTGLKDYYLGNDSLDANLRRQGKTGAIEQLEAIRGQAKFEFAEQSESAGYGTAVALEAALGLLDPSEPVVVCGGEDFVWRPDGSSEAADFIATFVKSGADGAIMALEISESDASQYGALVTEQRAGSEYLTDILEKPAAGHAATALVNISKYILSGVIRDYVTSVEPRPENSERYITDAITAATKDHRVVVHRVKGTYLDTGNPANWLHANQVIAADSAPPASS